MNEQSKLIPPGFSLFRSDLAHILHHTSGLWSELKSKRLFLTGGTGFFGMWLVESFLWANKELNLSAEICVLTRSSKAFLEKAPHLKSHAALTYCEGDVRNFKFPSGDFSYVIHAATPVNTKLEAEKPELIKETVIEGSKRVLEFAGKKVVKKLLFTSTGAVYEKRADLEKYSESLCEKNVNVTSGNVYAEAKCAAENLFSQNTSPPLECKIARCFAFIGPYLPLDLHLAAGNFIRDSLKGGPVTMNGQNVWRSYLYAADLTLALWTVLCKGVAGRPYNVGSEKALTMTDFAKTVAKVTNTSTKLSDLANQPAIDRYIPDTSRIERELNVHQNFSLEDSIKKTFVWHRQRAPD